MELRLGDKAPDFKQESTKGRIHFYEWAGGSWVVFFSHPGDFTPVCTTELGMVAKLVKEFAKRKVKVLGLSVDPLSSHRAWITDIFETQGQEVNFPILADKERVVADLYGMIHPNILANSTVRSVFIIDPDKNIRATITYPASTGRNFAEILRVIDSLQMTDRYKVATPADWTPGEEVVILPTIRDEAEMAKLFPKGHRTLTSYLRMTPDPTGNRKYEQAWSQYR
jgi:alkyl hydroperoxide reductase subunit AhpC